MIDQTFLTEHDMNEVSASVPVTCVKQHKHPAQEYIFGSKTNLNFRHVFHPELSCNLFNDPFLKDKKVELKQNN